MKSACQEIDSIHKQLANCYEHIKHNLIVKERYTFPNEYHKVLNDSKSTLVSELKDLKVSFEFPNSGLDVIRLVGSKVNTFKNTLERI